jgi:hypothetical protein
MTIEEVRRMAREAAREVLERNPDASLDEINAHLMRRSDAYNRAPQRELCGLSPNQVGRLLEDDWSGEGAIRIETTLPLETLESSVVLANARLLLDVVEERGEVKATAAGNLPRIVVEETRDRLLLPTGYPRRWMDRARNEEDVRPLHMSRLLLELAGLLKRRKGVFSATRRGRELLSPARAGELQALLFRTFFRTLNLAYLDGLPAVPELQHGIGASIHLFGRTARQWRTREEVAAAALLPFVLRAIAATARDDAGALVERRLLMPLTDFGLAECRESPRPGAYLPDRHYRRTPLFERMLRVDPGG